MSQNNRQLTLGLIISILILSSVLFYSALVNREANISNLESQVLRTISENPEAILQSVQNYQTKQEEEQAQIAEKTFARLKKKGSLIGESPTKGSLKQDAIMLEFSDFQCPFCVESHQVINEFMAQKAQDVKFVYKHFPVNPNHSEAMSAAKASWAANQQNKFWEYSDELFKNQDNLSEELYITLAQKLNLDLDKFNKDRKSTLANKAIQADIEMGKKFDVNGTPYILVNGSLLSGEISFDNLNKMLELEQSKNAG